MKLPVASNLEDAMGECDSPISAVRTAKNMMKVLGQATGGYKCQARLFAGQKISSWNEVKRRAATQTDWNFHHPKALEELKKLMLDREIWVDEGGAINTQPPPPETTVHIQEIGRDEQTGEVTLKIKPIYGDLVRYEIGDSEPTTASNHVAEVSGGYKTFCFS